MDLTGVVREVKSVNVLLSPIIFVLIVILINGWMYDLTKFLVGNIVAVNFNFLITACNTVLFCFVFPVLVILSSEIPIIISEMKSVILQVPEDKFYCQLSGTSASLLIKKLGNFKEEVTVTAFDLVTLNKNIILVTFGTVLTYELLLVQILEREK
ncbi:hypothetical protein AVEN_135991-1 [Araneus ventricosus]|uniref:Uncharacterized protein n=1 Tax=Araneus ventricosus TaxID=182803 RepID=A0A4Y2LCS6_ARAVE|nr:hypothetical protein AVEN_135991-1 [Araneus ventricosus]